MNTSKLIVLGGLVLAALGGGGYALATSSDNSKPSSDNYGAGLSYTRDSSSSCTLSLTSEDCGGDEKMETGQLDVTITLTSAPENAAKGISVNRQVSFSLPLVSIGEGFDNMATLTEEDFPEDEEYPGDSTVSSSWLGAEEIAKSADSGKGKHTVIRGPAENGLGYEATIEYGNTKEKLPPGLSVNTDGYIEGMSEARYVNWLPDSSDVEDDVVTNAQRKNCAGATASINDTINNTTLQSSRTVTQQDRGGFMCNTALTYDTETKTWTLGLGHANRLSMPLTVNGAADKALKETDLFIESQRILIKDIKPGKDGAFSVTRNDVATLPAWNNAGHGKDTPLVMTISWTWKPDPAPKTPAPSKKAPDPSDEMDNGWMPPTGTRMTF